MRIAFRNAARFPRMLCAVTRAGIGAVRMSATPLGISYPAGGCCWVVIGTFAGRVIGCCGAGR